MECVKLDREKFLKEITAKEFFPSRLNAVEKINFLMSDALRNMMQRAEMIKKALNLNSSMLLHQVRDYIFGGLSDKLAEFIREGNREGLFHCKYPQAVAETALFGLSHHYVRELERNPSLNDCLFGEYLFRERTKIREILMDMLNMEEPHGLFCFDEDEVPMSKSD